MREQKRSGKESEEGRKRNGERKEEDRCGRQEGRRKEARRERWSGAAAPEARAEVEKSGTRREEEEMREERTGERAEV